MPRSPAASRLRALILAGIGLAAFAAAPPARAQSAADDPMAFPRTVLAWFLGGEADRVWAHAGPALREMAGDADGLKADGAEIAAMMGPEAAVLGEQLLEHPEGGGWMVYVRAANHAQVPDVFWIVVFSPQPRTVQTIMAQTRQTVRTIFPEVTLP